MSEQLGLEVPDVGIVSLWVRPYTTDRHGVQRMHGDWRQLDPAPVERFADGRLGVQAPLLQDLADGQGIAVRGEDPTRRTYVVHVLHAPFDVYIGRHMSRYRLEVSPWRNPFHVTRHTTPAMACDLYRAYIHERPELLARLPELVGKTLGCWCKIKGPEPCHGDVLREFLIERGLIEQGAARS